MSSTNANISNANCASKYIPLKMSAWDSFKCFFQMRQKFGRYFFHPPGTPVKPDTESVWGSIKEFFQTRQKFGCHPFATKV